MCFIKFIKGTDVVYVFNSLLCLLLLLPEFLFLLDDIEHFLDWSVKLLSTF